jgi:hypothetical protein
MQLMMCLIFQYLEHNKFDKLCIYYQDQTIYYTYPCTLVIDDYHVFRYISFRRETVNTAKLGDPYTVQTRIEKVVDNDSTLVHIDLC